MDADRRAGAQRALAEPCYADPGLLAATPLFQQWWYYTMELLPGVVAKGQYEDDFPMLPRMMLRKAELEDMTCLDLGSMEGLIPALMKRGGAKEVLATDFSDHCAEKMEMVKHYYDVDFPFGSVGLMYDLASKIPGVGFDLINCSGLLYHVISPMITLLGARALLKRGGLMIVSTNVVYDDAPVMHFNQGGRMQAEANTFWYPTLGLLQYMLRYLKLEPIDALYMPHASINTQLGYLWDQPSGYASVLCRAVEYACTDPWMEVSAQMSWEHQGLCDWDRAGKQPVSGIRSLGNDAPIDLLDYASRHQVASPAIEADSHFLRLSAYS
jgi:SAM-dependent methyltransferase